MARLPFATEKPPFALWVPAAVILLPITIIIYRCWFHPLARVPGPKVASISRLWLAIQLRNGQGMNLSRTLHKKYGPAVRVAPDQIWFNSEESYDKISRFESKLHRRKSLALYPNVLGAAFKDAFDRSNRAAQTSRLPPPPSLVNR